MLKICKHTFYAYLSRIWKMMQYCDKNLAIRKVFIFFWIWHTALFQTYNCEKSSFSNTLLRTSVWWRKALTPVLAFRQFLQASAPSTFGPLDHYKTARASKQELCRRTNFYILYNKRNLTSSKCYASVCHSHVLVGVDSNVRNLTLAEAEIKKAFWNQFRINLILARGKLLRQFSTHYHFIRFRWF